MVFILSRSLYVFLNLEYSGLKYFASRALRLRKIASFLKRKISSDQSESPHAAIAQRNHHHADVHLIALPCLFL